MNSPAVNANHAANLAAAEAEAQALGAVYIAFRDANGPEAPGAPALRDLALAAYRKARGLRLAQSLRAASR